jgi:hypothetical protein
VITGDWKPTQEDFLAICNSTRQGSNAPPARPVGTLRDLLEVLAMPVRRVDLVAMGTGTPGGDDSALILHADVGGFPETDSPAAPDVLASVFDIDGITAFRELTGLSVNRELRRLLAAVWSRNGDIADRELWLYLDNAVLDSAWCAQFAAFLGVRVVTFHDKFLMVPYVTGSQSISTKARGRCGLAKPSATGPREQAAFVKATRLDALDRYATKVP